MRLRKRPHYLLLSGAVANAGDFLIRDSAVKALERSRPDRRLVVRDRREPLDPDDRDVRNAAAIILCGGPAWQPRVYPKIYPLTQPLGRLTAPITAFGLGWRAAHAHDKQSFRFSRTAMELLERIEGDGLPGTCRDFDTLDVLTAAGLTRQVMGGCPSWFHPPSFGKVVTAPETVGSLAFSVGALLTTDEGFAEQTLAVLSGLQQRYPQAQKLAVFHHPLGGSPNMSEARTAAQAAFAERAAAQGWTIVDVGGGLEGMVHVYATADLHVGYRVHAHLFRCSRRLPSVLIAEDSRGEGACAALGHSALPAVEPDAGGSPAPRPQLATEVIEHLDVQASTQWSSYAAVPERIAAAHGATQQVLAALP